MSGPGVSFVSFGDSTYILLYRELIGYADMPFLVGTYFETDDLLSEIYRLKWGIFASLFVAIVAAVAAAYIGRQIAMPVRRLSEAAKLIHHLELSQVKPIPNSFFTELNEAASSFNSMLDGLHWFERYVPRRLVQRLIQLDDEAGVKSEFREIAIMFADLVDFTSLSERLSADQSAEILNEHFAALAECIEAEGGVVDKFIGDSVMAIWGAPEASFGLADRAVRGALAIAEDMRARNTKRGDGHQMRLRIGLHLGKVVVGNIGSPDRINYTVVGDAVNVAQRLEELGKAVGDHKQPVNILISDNVKKALRGCYRMTDLGLCSLRGRQEKINIFCLHGKATDPAAGE